MKTTLEYSAYVECPKCGSKYSLDEIEVIHIEHSIFKDTITFECPRCDEVVKSLRYE